MQVPAGEASAWAVMVLAGCVLTTSLLPLLLPGRGCSSRAWAECGLGRMQEVVHTSCGGLPCQLVGWPVRLACVPTAAPSRRR